MADAVLQMHVIVNRSKNIFFCDMLRNQLMDIFVDRILNIFFAGVFFQYFLQYRIIYRFRIKVNPFAKVYHHIGENLYVTLLCLDPYKRNACILDLVCKCFIYFCTSLSQDLTGRLVYNILSQNLSADAVAKQQFFVELITSDFCKVISSRIEEHACDQALCTVNCQRFARTDLFVQLEQTFLIALGSIFCQAGKDFRFFTEQIDDLRIGSVAKCTDQNGDRHLSGSVYTNIENVIGVCLVFQPCTTVRNNGRRIQFFTQFIMCDCIIDARRTYQLADDYSLCTVDHEGTGCCHQWQISHKDLMLIDFIVLFIMKSYFYFQRCSICCVTFFTFFD